MTILTSCPDSISLAISILLDQGPYPELIHPALQLSGSSLVAARKSVDTSIVPAFAAGKGLRGIHFPGSVLPKRGVVSSSRPCQARLYLACSFVDTTISNISYLESHRGNASRVCDLACSCRMQELFPWRRPNLDTTDSIPRLFSLTSQGKNTLPPRKAFSHACYR